MLNFFSNAFEASLKWLCRLSLHSINVIYYIDLFSCVELLLHSQDKFHLIAVCYSFSMVLDSVCFEPVQTVIHAVLSTLEWK